jgi:hypothetical protein
VIEIRHVTRFNFSPISSSCGKLFFSKEWKDKMIKLSLACGQNILNKLLPPQLSNKANEECREIAVRNGKKLNGH